MQFKALLACGMACALIASFGSSQPQSQKTSIESSWQDLADDDAAKAYRATWTLAQNPAEAVKLLRQHLKQAPKPDLERINAWLEQLGDAKFLVRDTAFKALEQEGELAEHELQKALENAKDLETKRRIEMLLGRVQSAVLTPEKVRMVRALEVLECIGSADAAGLVKELAAGFPEHRQTREAQETLARIEKLAARGGHPEPAKKSDDGSKADPPLPKGALLRLGTTRFRQSDATQLRRRLAFSPDSAVIASAGWKYLHFWETQTGKLLDKHEIAATALAYAPKENVLAMAVTAQNANWLVLWNVGERKELNKVLLQGPGESKQLFYTIDGRQIVCKFEDQNRRNVEFRNFDAKSLQEISVLKSDNQSRLLGYAPNGKQVVLQQIQAPSVIWDLKTDTKIPFHRFSVASQEAVEYSPDGKLFAAVASFGTGLRIWDATTGKPLLVHVNESHGYYGPLLFSADGNYFAATRPNQRGITLWNPQTGEFLKDLPGSFGFDASAVSPNSRWLAGNAGYAIRVWDLRTGEPISEGDGHVNSIKNFAFLPKVKAFSTAGADGVGRLWDEDSGRQILVTKAPPALDVWGTDFSSDGKLFAASDMERDSAVTVHEIATGKQLYKFPGHGALGSLRRLVKFSADGRYLLSWSANDFYLRKWDLQNGKVVLSHRLQPLGIKLPEDDGDPNDQKKLFDVDFEIMLQSVGAFTSSGDQLVLATPKGSVHFFDTATGKESRVANVALGENRLYGLHLTLSPTNKHFALIATGRVVNVCDSRSGRILHALPLPESEPKTEVSVCISPDGRILAAAIGVKVIFAEIATGKQRLMQDLPGDASMIRFLPDGRRFVTAMRDTTALVWDIAALANPTKN